MKESPWAHIDAEVTLLPPSEGGRTNPPILVSGTTAGTYRPHIVIGDPNQRKAIMVGNEIRETYLGVVFVSGPEQVVFGEPLEAEAVLMYYPLPEHDAVVPGATFTIREGARIVGYGRVNRVFMPATSNKSLDRSAGGVFRNLMIESKVERNRRARSTPRSAANHDEQYHLPRLW